MYPLTLSMYTWALAMDTSQTYHHKMYTLTQLVSNFAFIHIGLPYSAKYTSFLNPKTLNPKP
jgi:hypothetical protein